MMNGLTLNLLLLLLQVLIKRLGRAYKHAAQQMQQHMTAYPVGGVQMVPMGQNAGAYPAPQPYQQQQYQQHYQQSGAHSTQQSYW